MSNKQLLKSLAAALTKGRSVRIAESYGLEHLRNIVTTIRSKGLVPCNQNGRCADGVECVGQAIFVVDPSVRPDESAGWRHGAAKVCLTHVINPETGAGVLGSVPAPVVAPAPEPAGSPEPETKPELVLTETDEDFVSWDQLARSHGAGNLDRLARQARALKCENDVLVRKLAELQERLIQRLDGSESPQETVTILDAEVQSAPADAGAPSEAEPAAEPVASA